MTLDVTFSPPGEDFAELHAEQWLGCVDCKSSHHITSFCRVCGKCFFRKKVKCTHDDVMGTFVTCTCGHTDLWD